MDSMVGEQSADDDPYYESAFAAWHREVLLGQYQDIRVVVGNPYPKEIAVNCTTSTIYIVPGLSEARYHMALVRGALDIHTSRLLEAHAHGATIVT